VTVPVRVKVLYGVGAIAESVKFFAFGLFLLFFYTSVLGLPGTLVGVAAAIGLAWDAFIDPLMGHWSDRALFRFGRRHTFMLVGSMLAGVTFFAIFSPPDGAGVALLFAWLIGTNLALRTTISAFTVPYYALGAELTSDYQGRTSVAAYRAGFALSGTLLAAVASFQLFFPTAGGSDSKFQAANYAWMGLAFGAAIALAGLTATLGTLGERGRLRSAAPEQRLGLVEGMRIAMSSRAFLALVVSASLFFLASVINASLAIHYLTYYARMADSASISLFQLAFYTGALCGIGAWVRASRRVDKHRLYLAGILITASLMFAAYALVGEGRLFGVGNVAPLVAGNALAGFFASALWVLPPSMVADIADEDQLRTGMRREATFYGMHSMGQQLAAGVALVVTGVALDRVAGLVAGQASQSAVTVERIGMLFGVLPAALLVAAAVAMLPYPLTRTAVTAVQRELGTTTEPVGAGRLERHPLDAGSPAPARG
jgi:GPH family glycoside/pentoside/hexuronide:cation symporter